jgi:hypothetical protein
LWMSDGDRRRSIAAPTVKAVPADTAPVVVADNSETPLDIRSRLEALETMAAKINSLQDVPQRITELQSGFQVLLNSIKREEARLDYALAEQEGLAKLRESFHVARRTPEYQAAFSDTKPLVTVVVTTFNSSRTLIERCVASLRAQTYSNLQIIVVGDHCTDDTSERLAEVGDSRIEFYNLDRHPYPPPGRDRWHVAGTHAANFAASRVRGQFMTHLDDDDTYEPQRIEMVLTAAQEHKSDLVWHRFWYQQPDLSWLEWGNGSLEYCQVGLGMIFYHSFFARLPGDILAYRLDEPGDWNRIRKIKYMRPRTHFVPRPLMKYYRYPERLPYMPADDDVFLD